MSMNDLRHKFGRLAVVAAALALAACSADELATEGGGSVAPPSGQTAASGTVSFTNNTSMTIGNGLDGITRAAWLTRGATFDMADNLACSLDMPEQPSTEGSETSEVKPGGDIGDISGKSVVITSELNCRIGTENGPQPRKLNNDVFVEGTLNLVNAVSDNGEGRIIVLPGGTLNVEMQTLQGIDILCYEGGTLTLPENGLTINADAAIMTKGSIDYDGVINVYGQLYVGGDLNCYEMTANAATIHVIGSVSTIDESLIDDPLYDNDNRNVTVDKASSMCVEGSMIVDNMFAKGQSYVHVGCKLVSSDRYKGYNFQDIGLNVTGNSVVCAPYIKVGRLSIASENSQVLLCDGGVIDACRINAGNGKISVYGNTGTAFVSVSSSDTKFPPHLSIDYGVKFEEVFVGNIYVNCSLDPSIYWVDAQPVDMTKINVAKLNSDEGVECSPGFTVPGTDPDPDPGTDPDDPEPDDPEPTTGGEIEIPIKIDDIIDESYILKADDFAIRVNGDYMADITIEEGSSAASLDGVEIVNDALTIIISGLVDNPAIIEGNDYTYECWIWVENKSLLNDGTGGYGPLFDYKMYEDWANPEGDPDAEDPYGYDMTKRISETGQVKSPEGFVVRYNVYRGLAGRVDADGHGDTPYIKVSVSVQKDPDARENTNVGIWPEEYNKK